MSELFPSIEGRTPLLAVAPIALEDAYQAECLSSYLVSSASRHEVAPRDLLRRLIIPLVESSIDSRTAFMQRHAHSIDGLGRYASSFSDCLQRLTDRTNLADATLLGLAPLLPSNGTPLLRPHRTWCGLCWSEDTAARRRCHGRLVWRLQLSSICLVHRSPLTTQCPHCGSFQPTIPVLPTLDRCNRCRLSLLTGRARSGSATAIQLAEATFAADLVRLRTALPPNPLVVLLDRLRRVIAASGRDRKAWCRSIGLQPRALCGWFSKGQHPSAEMLFRLCTALSVSLPDLLVDMPLVRTVTTQAPPGRQRRQHSETVRENVGLQLRSALRQADPPPLRAIAAKHDVSRTFLPYWFPKETRALMQRRSQARRAKHSREKARRLKVLQTVVQLQVNSDGQIRRKRTEAALRRERVSLLLPGVLESYRKQVKRWRKAAARVPAEALTHDVFPLY